jgi:hypothetical protein
MCAVLIPMRLACQRDIRYPLSMPTRRQAEYDPIRGFVMRILCKQRQCAFALHSHVSARGTACGSVPLALHSQVSARGLKPGDKMPNAIARPASTLMRIDMLHPVKRRCTVAVPTRQLLDTPASMLLPLRTIFRYGALPREENRMSRRLSEFSVCLPFAWGSCYSMNRA